MKASFLAKVTKVIKIEGLIVEMNVESSAASPDSYVSEKWRAQAKALAELIGHHLSEEEKDVFPLLKKDLTTQKDQQLNDDYERAYAWYRKTPAGPAKKQAANEKAPRPPGFQASV